MLLTMLPFLELRISIPLGVYGGAFIVPFTSLVLVVNPLAWYLVFLIAVISNFILGILLFNFMDFILDTASKIRFIGKIKDAFLIRAQNKIRGYVKKYGTIGLALFIALPLPGSGVYTGSLGAYALGFEKRQFYAASAIGVLLAGIIVTIITLFFRSLLWSF